MAIERWFLKIDGIVGGSVDAAHQGEIDVESWSWGLTNGSSITGGSGSSSARPVFQDIQFVTSLSQASPVLFLACAQGRHLRSAILSGVPITAGGSTTSLKVTMADVIISSFQLGDSAAAAPSQQFSMRYERVTITYVPQSPSGAPAAEVTAGWDVKQNRPI
jgi:type VI secretion system secreted protein Hcp